MVFNTTYNNISVISWRSVLLVEETGALGENHCVFSVIIYEGINKTPYIEVTIVHNTREITKK
jgi:hypothetical protein